MALKPRSDSNFAHLQELDPTLAVLGSHAERYFVDDPNTGLIKARQFAKRMAVVVAQQSGVELNDGAGFVDVLRSL